MLIFVDKVNFFLQVKPKTTPIGAKQSHYFMLHSNKFAIKVQIIVVQNKNNKPGNNKPN